MAEQSRTTLKGYFNTGDTPSEANFADLIDSVPNITDEASTKWTKYTIANDAYVPANNWTAYGSGDQTWSYTITHNLGTKNVIPSFKLSNFATSSEDDWDVLDFNQLRNALEEVYTFSNPVITTNAVTFIVSGSAVKPEIVFYLRLLKV